MDAHRLGSCAPLHQARNRSTLLGQEVSGPVFSRLLTCGEHTPTKAILHDRLLAGPSFCITIPWSLWVSMSPAPGEGWSPGCGGGQFALLQGDRAAYANAPLVVVLNFEEQMSTELGATPSQAVFMGLLGKLVLWGISFTVDSGL